MAAEGPVCHLPSNTVASPHGAVSLPSIPPASPNLASLTATVNALRQVIMIYTGQQNQQQGFQRIPGPPSGSWKQGNVVTEKVKVYQNNDPSTGNFVEVNRINSLTFNNQASNQTITFNRPPDSSGS